MASMAVVLMILAWLRFADIGSGVRRQFGETEDFEEGSIDLAHEKQRSLDQSVFFKSGKTKLNVLVLHGTAQSGPQMKRSFDGLGVTRALKDIANLYYPTGPHVVPRWHPLITSRRKRYSQNNRHWYNMGARRNFNSASFNEARRSIPQFVDREIQGPVDVVCGYAQGAAAATTLLNEIFYGRRIRNENLKKVRAAIFLAVPQPARNGAPFPSAEVGKRVKSLHCHGRNDRFSSVAGARRHAAAFKNDMFHVYNGGHALKSIAEPMRKFLLSLKG